MHNANMIYGSARLSTGAQDLASQLAQLEAAGCEKIFREKITIRTGHPDRAAPTGNPRGIRPTAAVTEAVPTTGQYPDARPRILLPVKRPANSA